MIKRLRGLDVFRGLTVAGMIVVNCSGSDDVYRQFEHAPWHGMTLADLVFPSFLMMVGVSAAYSHAARRERGHGARGIAGHAALRAAGLFLLGLMTDVVLYHGTRGVRWPGVLQRIAVCSLAATGFLLADLPALEIFAAAVLLIGYWLLMTRVPVPGHGPGDLSPAGNLASWLDRRLIGGHMMTPIEDQEGLLSTLPAIATTLIGLVAGRRLVAGGSDRAASLRLAAAGAVLTALGLGWAWGLGFPLNKHLWTSSFALASGGICLGGLAACLLAWGETPPRWTGPLESLGRHALAFYVGSGFVYGVMEFVTARLPDGSSGNVKLWLDLHLFASWLPAKAASLAFALCFAAAAAAAARRVDPR